MSTSSLIAEGVNDPKTVRDVSDKNLECKVSPFAIFLSFLRDVSYIVSLSTMFFADFAND